MCHGSANEIPLQNSSALLGSVVPIWLCRLRRVGLFVDAAGACCAVRWLCAAREQTVLQQRFFIDQCDLCAASIVPRSRFAVVVGAAYVLITK